MWFTLTTHGARHAADADADTAAPTSGPKHRTSAELGVSSHIILTSHDRTGQDTHVIREHMYTYVTQLAVLGYSESVQTMQCMGYDTVRYDTIRYTPQTSISGPESSRNTDMDTDSDRDRDMNTAGSRKGDKRYSPPHGYGHRYGHGRQEHRSTGAHMT